MHKPFEIRHDLWCMLQDEPFFSIVSLQVDKVILKENHACKTACVWIQPNGKYAMGFNQKFMDGLDLGTRKKIMLHEFMHLALLHLTHREIKAPAGYSQSQWNRLVNMAQDLAINTNIKDFPLRWANPDFAKHTPETPQPKWCHPVIPGVNIDMSEDWVHVPEDKRTYYMKEPYRFVNYPTGCTSEQYFQMLLSETKLHPAVYRTMDAHEIWGSPADLDGNPVEMDLPINDIAEAELRNLFKIASQNAAAKGWGTVPMSIQGEIIKFVRGKLDWRSILRYFCKKSQRGEHRHSIRRRNRKQPWVQPGVRLTKDANICIGVDESGSVSDELLSLLGGELPNLSKIVGFTVVPFDTAVNINKIYKWEKGRTKFHRRSCRGGTDFNCITDYVNSHPEFDALIILTDMGCSAPKPCRVPRMYMTDRANYDSPWFKTNDRVIPVED